MSDARPNPACLITALVTACALACTAVAIAQPGAAGIDAFLSAAARDDDARETAQTAIAAGWQPGHAAMIVDLLDLAMRTRAFNPGTFSAPRRLIRFLETQTGQSFGNDLDAWRHWVWSLPYEPHPDYAEFKGKLYAQLDSRFEVFFRNQPESTIRLDEIQWGGVSVNGIPPLRYPRRIAAPDAEYLDDADIVFGFRVDGEASAYPKRILAWHELALDKVGDREMAIVYCTLCGTVIPFDARVDGEVRTFGTSGLLYQSNKLMFDHEGGSLWSSLTGEPVVGPLVGRGLRLEPLPVVTTTWGEWRRLHPDTTVLSVDTGFERDYSEGAAYREYFATDELMFDVSRRDDRLENKAEVLVLRSVPSDSGNAELTAPFAISTRILDEQRVFHVSVDNNNLVVVTSDGGANRVYVSGAYRFVSTDGESALSDVEGREWIVTEGSIEARFDANNRLPRVSAHRAFWFGWYAQHPDTILIE